MSVTTTSRIAYKELNKEGIGETQKTKIMYVVREHYNIHNEGISLREIASFTKFDINAVSGRVNDLKKDELLETTEKRRCSITKRLISPVIPKSESKLDKVDEDEINKLKLLLNLYQYKQFIIKDGDEGNKRIKIGNFELINNDDIVKIHSNCNLRLKEVSFYDEDRGRLFWYDIKK